MGYGDFSFPFSFLEIIEMKVGEKVGVVYMLTVWCNVFLYEQEYLMTARVPLCWGLHVVGVCVWVHEEPLVLCSQSFPFRNQGQTIGGFSSLFALFVTLSTLDAIHIGRYYCENNSSLSQQIISYFVGVHCDEIALKGKYWCSNGIALDCDVSLFQGIHSEI